MLRSPKLQGYEAVQPVDITRNKSQYQTTLYSEKEPQILARPARSDSESSSSTTDSPPRRARFAEATSVHSPAAGPGEHRSPFADPPKMSESKGPASEFGMNYISDQPVEQHATIRTDLYGAGGMPLKSALKTPGQARFANVPLTATFKEEQTLDKEEEKTEKQQAKDLKIKTRVRMAKMVLRGVNFSCSLIVLAMLSTVLTIFHATKNLPPRNNLPAWAPNQQTWPQILVLCIACVSLLFSVIVMAAYCRGGHRRAEKVAVYYTMFAVGWFIFSIVMWVIGASVFHSSKANGGGSDMWAWSCKDNKRRTLFEDDVNFALACRLQDWTLVCCIIEIIVEVMVIAIYGVVFYRFYSKNRLRKSMSARDRARNDLYLAQLRTQSAPNTPGFMFSPMKAAFPTTHTKSVDSLSDAEEGRMAPPPPATRFESSSNQTTSPFKLQAPPPSRHGGTLKSPENKLSATPRSPSPPQERINEHFGAAPGEQTYAAVPIPGAYATAARPF